MTIDPANLEFVPLVERMENPCECHHRDEETDR